MIVMSVEEILQEVIKICKRYNVGTALLFGSRAKGTATERSDIDIAVAGVKDIDGLREEIEELPTLYSFDVIDMDTCRNELLLEEIKKYGRKIL